MQLVITCTDTISTACQTSSLVHRWHLKWLLSHDVTDWKVCWAQRYTLLLS